MSLLKVEGLVKVYGRRTVVNGVDYEVHSGEIVGLLGPNGAGKTTTFRMTIGMIPANGGRVLLNGTDVTNTPMYRRARLGMGYLSQEPSIFRKLTVEQNILAILETMNLSRSKRRARTESLLSQFGLSRLSTSPAMTLSGGERRRLEIARCLVCEPSLILLDEPFTGIDPMAIADIQDIIKDLKDRGIGLLLTDHNVRETLAITDRSYLVYDGRVLTHGEPHKLVRDPEAVKFYLGERFEAGGIGERRDGNGDRPAPSFKSIILEDEVNQLISRLQSDDQYEQAQQRLAELGGGVVPFLLKGLEARDRKTRLRTKQVAQRFVGPIDFDPYARADKRFAQLVRLRRKLNLA